MCGFLDGYTAYSKPNTVVSYVWPEKYVVRARAWSSSSLPPPDFQDKGHVMKTNTSKGINLYMYTPYSRVHFRIDCFL